LAQHPVNVLDALEKYGIHLGVAFQITDDLLDLTGEEAVVGKTLRTDLLNGKMTLPLIHFRDHLTSASEETAFFDHLKNPNAHLSQLVNKMKKSGSIDYAQTMAHQHIKDALTQLINVPASKTRAHLSSLAEMLQTRKA